MSTELSNGVIIPEEYSDDWYDEMSINLRKLNDVIGSDSEKLNADGVDFLRMSSAALTDGGTGNFSDLNSSYKIKTGDLVLDSGRKLYQIVSVDSTNETFTVGNYLFKVTAESDLALVAESGDYDDLDNKPDLNPYDQHIANTDIHVTTADKTKWNNGVSQAYVVRYASVAVSDNSTVPYTDLNNTDNIKANDLLLDTNGKIYQISSVDTANETVSVTTPLTRLAVNSSVVHNTGNETKSGELTLSSTLKSSDIVPRANLTFNLGTPDYKYNNVYAYMYNSIGLSFGNESSSNQRTNITLYANRDTQNQSCAYITRFRQNRSQGALQSTDLQKIGFDVLENEVRTNNVFDIQCTDWLNNVPQKVNLVSSVPSYSYGRSSNKALINDLNPGSLSLPDLNNGVDISSYITYLDKRVNTYTPPANGYISIRVRKTTLDHVSIRVQQNYGLVNSSETTEFSVWGGYLPVIANQNVEIYIYADALASAKFYPCQGNI